MFLHSGASLHGHEYSNRRPSPQPPHKRLPLLRNALRPLSDVDMSFNQQHLEPRRSSDSDCIRPTLRQRPASGLTFRRELSVRFDDAQRSVGSTNGISEDDSVAESELSDAMDLTVPRRKRARRAPRQSTSFALAHPAPQLRTKQRRLVQLRPRLLLQLQRLGDKRAVPAYDVLPSSLIAGSLPKLAERFPRMFRKKPELGQDDVLIVHSEIYDLAATDSSNRRRSVGGHDGLNHRDVLGVISMSRRGDDVEAEIDLEDGSTWLAKRMANGSFEFVSTDCYGRTTTARWVKRTIGPARRDSGSNSESSPPPSKSKWTFSIIDPTTKRHPIMGILKSQSLEIFDQYSTMSTSSGRYPPSRYFATEPNRSPRTVSSSRANFEERTTSPVLDHHKMLMLASGIFVGLKNDGWSTSVNPRHIRLNTQCRTSSSSAPASALEATLEKTMLREQSPLTMSPKEMSPEVSREPSPDKSLCRAKRHSAPVPPPGRTLSSGQAYMRRRSTRRETLYDETEPAVAPDMTTLQPTKEKEEEEKTRTCRIKLRHLANRIFHRQSAQPRQNQV